MDTFDIYIDDYHLHSLSERLPTLVGRPLDGLGDPSIRLSSYNNPGEHGQTVTNALYGERRIVMQGSIRGTTVDEYRANREAFRQAVALQYNRNGYPIFRVLKLVINNRSYRLEVATADFDLPDTLPISTRWKLELVATKWVIESETISTATVGLPQPGGLTWPTTWPVTWTGGTSGQITITNPGTAPASPIITIPGPVINPVLTNATTGERIGLNLTLGSTDEVVIDCFERTIIQGGATNRIGTRQNGSAFWALQPGSIVIYYSADTYDTSQAEISWRASFGGV